MLRIFGGFIIIVICALYLAAYIYKPPETMFWPITYSALLIIGIAEVVIGSVSIAKKK
jgi:hypothetical protein